MNPIIIYKLSPATPAAAYTFIQGNTDSLVNNETAPYLLYKEDPEKPFLFIIKYYLYLFRFNCSNTIILNGYIKFLSV